MSNNGESSAPSVGVEKESSELLSEKELLKKQKQKEKKEQKAAKAAKAKAKANTNVISNPSSSNSTDKSEKEQKKKDKGQSKQETEQATYVNNTPKGQKKDVSGGMPASYDPKYVESAWYDWWVSSNFFTPSPQKLLSSSSEPVKKFVMVIPPPNVTGSLHLGHALTNSVEDTITRWHRMKGEVSLWIPGTDHAGIATQVVVEKKLMRENGISRHDLGREKFIQEVWKWKEEYGGRIVNQLKRLGSSLDWTREVFTMDAKLSNAVNHAFVQLYNKGLIYRDTRLVNWCCKLNTAISDIEVEHLEIAHKTKMRVPGHGDKEYEFGLLYEFAYKLEGSNEEIVVATTRPETMLADTAVAIHPKDSRYQQFHGKFVVHPFVDRKLPIICDDILVNMEFGTGAVKVTPAHDPNDYKCGKRHNLPYINLLNDDGSLNHNAGKFQGMKRFDARVEVIKELTKLGLYKGSKDNAMTLAICSRSKDVIEPIVKPQWWVMCKQMAEKATDAVRTGKLQIIPSTHQDTWFRWLDNIQDWCISRQLWWGHRCPAYLVQFKDHPMPDSSLHENWVVGVSHEDAMKNAARRYPHVNPHDFILHQDPDVLDTWFSSGLFPFSVMGWPNNTEDLQAFYPTSLLETGHDILFFWVARMVMLGIELTGKVPFSQVFLHAMVRDAHGRKMSKSLGNVIDPVYMIEGISLEDLHKTLYNSNLDSTEIEKAKQGQASDYPKGIPECGTDATRFALCAYTSQGRDINLDVNRVGGYRNFCNKLWNATKFALSNLGSQFIPAAVQHIQSSTTKSPWERWILSRLNHAIRECNEGFANYDFAQATTAIYNFWLYDLCDVYLESMKPTMQKTAADTELVPRQNSLRETLYTCLHNGLRLLHPFMPFLTEELYQRLPKRQSETGVPSICVAPYPNLVPGWEDQGIEKNVKLALDIIHSVRKLRSSFNLTKEYPSISVNFQQQDIKSIIDDNQINEVVAFLTHSSTVSTTLNQLNPPEGCAVDILNETTQVYMLVKGLVDIGAEIDKLEKKKLKIQADHDKLLKLTQGPSYNKVPLKLQEENTKKLEGLIQELETANVAIQTFRKFL